MYLDRVIMREIIFPLPDPVVQYIVHTYHNDTEEPPTTAEVWHWSKLCSGFTQAGTVNFHPRQQVCLMAVSPLSDVCESRIHFFFLQQQKDFRESCRSSATYDLWLKAES